MSPATSPDSGPNDPAVTEVADPTGFAGDATRMRLLGLLTAVLLIGGLIAVAFVGPSGTDVEAADLVAAAGAVGEQADSVAFESTSTYLFAGLSGGDAVATGRASKDGRAEVKVRFDGLPLPDYTFVSDGNLVFAEVPKENRSKVDGKRWAAAPLGDEGFAMFGAVGDVSDPVPPLEGFLSGAKGDVTTVGRETVRGVDTTHYRVRVDPAGVFEEALSAQTMPGGGQPGFGGVTGDVDIDVAPVGVWLDDEGRLRRMEIRIDIDADGVSGRMQMRHEFFDYDVPVTVTLPNSSDVFLVDSPATLQSLLLPAP